VIEPEIRLPEQNDFKRTEPTCICHLLDEIKIKQKQIRQKSMERISESNSLVNKLLLKVDFNNFNPKEFQTAFNQTRSYAESFNPNNPEYEKIKHLKKQL